MYRMRDDFQVLKEGLHPVLCIGETKEEYEAGLNHEVRVRALNTLDKYFALSLISCPCPLFPSTNHILAPSSMYCRCAPSKF